MPKFCLYTFAFIMSTKNRLEHLFLEGKKFSHLHNSCSWNGLKSTVPRKASLKRHRGWKSVTAKRYFEKNSKEKLLWNCAGEIKISRMRRHSLWKLSLWFWKFYMSECFFFFLIPNVVLGLQMFEVPKLAMQFLGRKLDFQNSFLTE